MRGQARDFSLILFPRAFLLLGFRSHAGSSGSVAPSVRYPPRNVALCMLGVDTPPRSPVNQTSCNAVMCSSVRRQRGPDAPPQREMMSCFQKKSVIFTSNSAARHSPGILRPISDAGSRDSKSASDKLSRRLLKLFGKSFTKNFL